MNVTRLAVMWRVLLVALLGVVAVAVVRTLWLAGSFKRLQPHFDGVCVAVGGLAGPEDLTIHPRTGVAYVSAQDRGAVTQGRPGRGTIYAYDLDAPAPRLVDLTPGVEADYRPHGLSLWVDDDGKATLFVVTHSGGRHAVEIWDVVGDGLRQRATLTDPLLVSPNDVVAVAADRFYVTNDHGRPAGLGRLLEEYLRLPLANVVYYDGKNFVEAAARIRMANGINVSPDGLTIYVASTTGRSVRVYDRDRHSGMLGLREEIPLGTAPDNLELDAAGNLWIGAHPKLLATARHLGTDGVLAPSQVLRVSPGAKGRWEVEEVYLGLGEELSASSVAAVRDDRLLIGAVRAPRFLDCRLVSTGSAQL